MGVAAVLLGSVQCDVAVFDQRGDVITIKREKRNTDAGTDIDISASEKERRSKTLLYLPGDNCGIFIKTDVAQQQGKAVAAKSGQGIFFSDRVAYP